MELASAQPLKYHPLPSQTPARSRPKNTASSSGLALEDPGNKQWRVLSPLLVIFAVTIQLVILLLADIDPCLGEQCPSREDRRGQSQQPRPGLASEAIPPEIRQDGALGENTTGSDGHAGPENNLSKVIRVPAMFYSVAVSLCVSRG